MVGNWFMGVSFWIYLTSGPVAALCSQVPFSGQMKLCTLKNVQPKPLGVFKMLIAHCILNHTFIFVATDEIVIIFNHMINYNCSVTE